MDPGSLRRYGALCAHPPIFAAAWDRRHLRPDREHIAAPESMVCVPVANGGIALEAMAPLFAGQKQRVLSRATQSGFKLLSQPQAGVPLTSMPLVAPHPVTLDQIAATHHITCAKYYEPLETLPFVDSLFARLVNVPCHPGIAALTDHQILQDLSLIPTTQAKPAKDLLYPARVARSGTRGFSVFVTSKVSAMPTWSTLRWPCQKATVVLSSLQESVPE